jgi:hypothetical protein
LPVPGSLSPYTKRYAKGPSGEILDAFAFANFDAGNWPVNVKAGQHTVYWGESLLFGGAIHGISYSQNSIDAWKAFATPGSERRSCSGPRGGLTIQAQPTHDLSLAGQWFYNWQAIRVPESGSYLTVNDALNFGGESQIVAPNPFAAVIPGAPAYLRVWNTNNVPPSRTSGNLGTSAWRRGWSPEWLDGTLGFYYRNGHRHRPQAVATAGLPAQRARRCLQPRSGRDPLAAPTASSTRTRPRCRPAEVGKVGTYQTAYGATSTSTAEPVEAIAA